MPRLKLTKTAIAKIKPDPSGKQTIHWDEEQRGFGVLVSGKTDAKTYICQKDLPDGRTRRITVGAFGLFETVEEARDRARRLLLEMQEGKDPRAKKQSAANWTLQTALDKYLEGRKDLKPATAEDYRASIERYLESWLTRSLSSITADMVEDRHTAIQKEVAARRNQPEHWQSAAGAHMANAVFRVFRAVWNYASERAEDLPANPVRRLRKNWFADPKRERIVGAQELPAFYQAAMQLPNPVARDYVLLMLFTGLRRVEAAALRWDEIDFVERVIRLPAKRTKAGRRLDLPMSSFVRDLLVARRAPGNEGGWVFPADSKSGHIEEPSSAFEFIAEASGIRVSSHDLRRTFVTVAESTDISSMALKALVNHSVGNDVTSGYVQMSTERLREPVERVGTKIMALCGIEPLQGIARI